MMGYAERTLRNWMEVTKLAHTKESTRAQIAEFVLKLANIWQSQYGFIATPVQLSIIADTVYSELQKEGN